MSKKKSKMNAKKIKENISKNYWKIATIALAVLLIAVLISNGSASTTVSSEVAGQKVLDFANAQGANAELVSTSDDGSLYEVVLSIEGQEIPVYVTKDGKTLVPQPISLEIEKTPTTPTPSQPAPTPTVVKSDKPVVELFVMSFCPYGNRGEDTMLPIYNLLKDKVDWKVNYIVSVSGDTIRSLHGQPETDQNIREVCVKRDYGMDAFWKFITYVNKNCGRDGSCWEDAAKETGVDPIKIQSCFDNDGLDLMKSEASASNNAGASGSPTLLINGVKSNVVYQYENTEAYKQAICAAFNEAPEECNQILDGTVSASAGGSC